MSINHFYVSKEHFILLYETKEAAKEATAFYGDNSKYIYRTSLAYALRTTNYIEEKIKSKVKLVGKDELILLVRKEKRYWQVVVGENIGWIRTTGWPTFLKEFVND